MVRKRGRPSRKYYDSEEDNDSSDLEFDLNETSQPAQKKYSLRQRKRPLFTADFDYDDDEDDVHSQSKAKSDDEDFHVEEELEANAPPLCEYLSENPYSNDQEQEIVPEDPDALIDFEDIIRADIVVNKRRIDYDNAISKTEIKLQNSEAAESTGKGKRGPKKDQNAEMQKSYFEPELGIEEEEEYEDENDEDYSPEYDLESKHISEIPAEVEKEVEDTECSNCILNSEHKSDEVDPLNVDSTNTRSDGIKCTNLSNSNKDEDIIKLHVNGKVNSNDPGSQDTKIHEVLEDEDDDDVVFIEDSSKSEIIVLDD